MSNTKGKIENQHPYKRVFEDDFSDEEYLHLDYLSEQSNRDFMESMSEEIYIDRIYYTKS